MKTKILEWAPFLIQEVENKIKEDKILKERKEFQENLKDLIKNL